MAQGEAVHDEQSNAYDVDLELQSKQHAMHKYQTTAMSTRQGPNIRHDSSDRLMLKRSSIMPASGCESGISCL